LSLVFCGLQGGNGGGFGCRGFFPIHFHHFLDQPPGGALAFFGFADFGAGGEDAQGRVDGDLFYGLLLGLLFVPVAGGFR
jgi:hypothetical protein